MNTMMKHVIIATWLKFPPRTCYNVSEQNENCFTEMGFGCEMKMISEHDLIQINEGLCKWSIDFSVTMQFDRLKILYLKTFFWMSESGIALNDYTSIEIFSSEIILNYV